MKKLVIKVTTKSGETVKVFVNEAMMPTGVVVFKYYIPKKYEISYVVGNNTYRYSGKMHPCNKYGELVCISKFCKTAKVDGVFSAGRNVKNKKGEFVKYNPNISHVVIIEAMPDWIIGGTIDNPEIAYLPNVALALFNKFCKIL